MTSLGHLVTRPHASYPGRSSIHPSDHIFSWEKGRVLESWQIVVIHNGSGQFESKPTGTCHLVAGSTFLIFPGVWHRYRPDPGIGWSESWLEINGAMIDQLWSAGEVDPARAVQHLGGDSEFLEALFRCQTLATGEIHRSGPLLASATLETIARWVVNSSAGKYPPKRIDSIVHRARTILMSDEGLAMPISQLAKLLSVAPAHLRRSFRAQTGIPPKEYQQQIRLRRARSLLRNSDLSVTEIAELLHYSSAFHLSAEFKKAFGIPPTKWRSRSSDN